MGPASQGDGDYIGQLLAEQADFMPQVGMFPRLSREEVRRFAALGPEGWNRLREGNEGGAEAAFRTQIGIFGANPEPHVSLALLAARKEQNKAALAHLRDAIVRGFSDLPRVERAEVWRHLRSDPQFLGFIEAMPRLLDAERRWCGWETFSASRPPETVSTALGEHERRRASLEAMAPAIGPRLTSLWNRWNDRATAALLEAYIAERREAPEVNVALDRLIELYSGHWNLRWEILSAGTARRLQAVARVALERADASPLRPAALTCLALASHADRDRKGALRPEAVEAIRASLREVLDRHAGSPFAVAAAEGLVRTEVEAGRFDLAAQAYLGFQERHAGSAELLNDVRGRLGNLALRVGGVPDFRATALDGITVERDALRGKVVVVDFWATWCRPCVEEFPTLRRIQERFSDNVMVLGVNLDRVEDFPAKALQDWLVREQVPGVHLYDGRSWESDLVRAFGVTEIPFSVVVAPDGAVLAIGERGRRLEKAVQEAVRGRRTL